MWVQSPNSSATGKGYIDKPVIAHGGAKLNKFHVIVQLMLWIFLIW